MKDNTWTIMFSSLCVVIGILMLGCEKWSGSKINKGSTIRGNVSTFETGNVEVFFSSIKKESLLKKIILGLSEALVTSAFADGGVQGVKVYLKNTGYITTTTEDGAFVISGVAEGTYEIAFRYGDTEGSYPLTVQAYVTIELSNVRIIDRSMNFGIEVFAQNDPEPESEFQVTPDTEMEEQGDDSSFRSISAGVSLFRVTGKVYTIDNFSLPSSTNSP